jgi:6-phosphogluconolactonase
MSKRVIVADGADQLSVLAGRILIEETSRAIDRRGRAVVLVSGGTSVWKAYEAYGRSDLIDWTKVFFFWGDDRFVEPENPYSNYALVRDSLLTFAKGLPVENVFSINYKADTPGQCAEQYSRTIQQFFNLGDDEWPTFDLAQVGMGADGHTASLFPHTPAVLVDDKLAVMNHAGLRPWVDRITLTLPVFNHVRTVLFITSGSSKTQTLKNVLEGSPTVEEMPAAHINPADGTVIWLADKAAAAELTIPIETDY